MNSTRRNGLLILCGGAALFVLAAVAAVMLAGHGFTIHGFVWGIPGAIALVGLLQLVSGVPFSELSERWDSLAGWQRGVLGIGIVLASLPVIMGLMMVVARLLYG